MPRYRVVLVAPASTTVEVDADDKDDAYDVAANTVHVSLCHECGRKVEIGDEWGIPDENVDMYVTLED